jgi:hypothetical protein
MVDQAIDNRRHAADVYGTSDGRRWVQQEDYEALMAKATVSFDEWEAMEGIANVIKRLLEIQNGLTNEELATVGRWLEAWRAMLNRLNS